MGGRPPVAWRVAKRWGISFCGRLPSLLLPSILPPPPRLAALSSTSFEVPVPPSLLARRAEGRLFAIIPRGLDRGGVYTVAGNSELGCLHHQQIRRNHMTTAPPTRPHPQQTPCTPAYKGFHVSARHFKTPCNWGSQMAPLTGGRRWRL